MVDYNPQKVRSSQSPNKAATQLANELEQDNNISDKILQRIRTSEEPFAVPIGNQIGSTGSLRSTVRYVVLKNLRNTDGVIQVSFSKVDDEKWINITTHPSLLKQSNRLLPQAALAKAYEFGYWPSGWSSVEGGDLPESVDSAAGVPHEQRQITLIWKGEYDQRDFETTDNWFNDEEAVSEFAARTTDDNVSWEQYIPWYTTIAAPTYRINQIAQTTDWTKFPDQPDTRPNIEDRFDTSTNPTVGNFIRMAVLQKIEQNLPIITNLSTGPHPWATDRISLVVDPSAGEGRPDGAILCPHVVLKKLAEYGYRPIDGWYDAPTIGYESDDPIEPRRIEFARGKALRAWWERIQQQSPLFDNATTVRETNYLTQIDWETFISCMRSQIISYHELHKISQDREALF